MKIFILALLILLELIYVNGNCEIKASTQAKIDAQNDINGNYEKWFFIGLLGNIFGVGYSYFAKINIPEERLIGKPPEYLEEYFKEYKKSLKIERLKKSLTGATISSIVILYYLGLPEIYKACILKESSCSFSNIEIIPNCSFPLENWNCSSSFVGCSGTSTSSGGCGNGGSSSGCGGGSGVGGCGSGSIKILLPFPINTIFLIR